MIIIGKNLFAINNPDQTLKIDTTLLKPYLSQCYEQNDDEFDFETIDDDTFYRSPRFKRDVEKAVFKIDAPPASQVGEEMPMRKKEKGKKKNYESKNIRNIWKE